MYLFGIFLLGIPKFDIFLSSNLKKAGAGMGIKWAKNDNLIVRNIRWAMRLAALIGVIVILFWGFGLPQDVTIYSQEDFAVLDSGWTQVLPDVHLELEDLASAVEQRKETPIVIQRTITEDMLNESVVFYGEHQEIFVYVGETEVYSFTCPEELETFGSPGRTWVNVPINEDELGETLTIALRSNFTLYHGLPASIFCVDDGVIYAVQTNFLALRNTVALIVIGLALVSYINAVLWEDKQLKRYLFTMADLYLFIGLWLCAEVNVLAIWLGRASLSAVMAMVFLRMVPIAFYYFFMSMLPYVSWRTRLAGFVAWLNFFAAIISQFVFGKSLIETLGVNVAAVITLCVIGLYEVYHYYRYENTLKVRANACYFTIILFLATLLECTFYLNYQTYGNFIGLPLTIACIIYAGIAHMILVHSESQADVAKRRLEEEYNKLNKKPLEQQINAHFLYNSLNTISAYCKESPDKAYDAICIVGKYMRAYTHLVNADEYVTLEEELDLIQKYVIIQNMRFENSLKFTVNNNCEDVWLPALTLQPLVENAINHGIRKDFTSGEIKISADYSYNMVKIVVEDNGVGFNIDELKNAKGVGYRNLKHRLNVMGGEISVSSIKNVGTKVTVIVPEGNGEDEVDDYENFICR